MLPEIKKYKAIPCDFPARWQAVIFRNYGLVPAKTLAAILETTESVVLVEAERLGLKRLPQCENFVGQGYITIIRGNWDLLPYGQLKTLVGLTDKEFEFAIKEEDFLFVKLGFYKPYAEKVTYAPLTKEQLKRTAAIRRTVEKYVNENYRYFGFLRDIKPAPYKPVKHKYDRMIHGYLTSCGDVFKKDCESHLSDALLSRYAALGVTEIFIHGVLSALSPYPFKPALADGYEVRRKNLAHLTERAAAYGIKIILYLNEPRGLPVEDFKNFPHLLGTVESGYGALCFEQKEVQKYLYEAVKDLLKSVPELGGIMMITMSENLTHCRSKSICTCERCKNVSPEQSASSVLNVAARAVKDAGTHAKLIANLWGWSAFMGWTTEQLERGIKLLDEDIELLTVSEYDKEIEKGGVKNRIIDYSVSNPGPSGSALVAINLAKKYHRKIYAKIQTGCSWELSCVPYLPAYDLIAKHVNNLKKIGVNDLMLTWTLGGYPSPCMSLVRDISGGISLGKFYAREYGENAGAMKKAVKTLCKGFKEYPFDVNALYYSPKNLGVANLWSLTRDERESAMVSYSFDDYEKWVAVYGYDVYVSQMKKVIRAFKKSLKIMNDEIVNLDEKVEEAKRYVAVAINHYEADVLQTKYARIKRESPVKAESLSRIIKKEKQLAKELIELAAKDSKIGYETSNHYFYTQNSLLEKIVNSEVLLSKLKSKEGCK